MDGTMLCGLRRFLVAEYGESTWEEVVSASSVTDQLFVPVTNYPVDYYYALVEAAAAITGQDQSALERSFGRSFATDLLDDVPDEHGLDVPGVDSLEDSSEEDGLDLLASAESWAGDAFAVDASGGRPLDCERLDDYRVRLVYDCPVGLCPVVRGLVDGVAHATDTDLLVEEPECIHDGDHRCTLMVTAAATSTRQFEGVYSGPPEATD
jgi:hypothetical protein